jgi:mono/diheme cytochrome c family protein
VNTSTRLSRIWSSVRPRTRRGGILAAAGILAGAAALSAVLFVGAAMAWSPYLTFSLDRTSDAKRTAGLELTFASSSTCAACHEPEAARLASKTHAGIGCQSCHGALLEHTLESENPDAATVKIAVPTDEVCVRCHVQATGRPAGLRGIIPSEHYTSTCLACHDPHTALANRPPVVGHPLEKLPPCLTCHGPEGFKARNQRHPAGTSDDKPCLDCHAAGRGPAEDNGGTE